MRSTIGTREDSTDKVKKNQIIPKEITLSGADSSLLDRRCNHSEIPRRNSKDVAQKNTLGWKRERYIG
jgi:hypothetical protein